MQRIVASALLSIQKPRSGSGQEATRECHSSHSTARRVVLGKSLQTGSASVPPAFEVEGSASRCPASYCLCLANHFKLGAPASRRLSKSRAARRVVSRPAWGGRCFQVHEWKVDGNDSVVQPECQRT